MRAVVLAAGLGSRLRPLTEFQPKPLLPVAGRAIIEHTLSQLAHAGCEAAALNLHHLGHMIRERLGDTLGPMRLVYSEEPEIRGTLGALSPLEEFLAPADAVLVVNGDSLMRWPFKKLVKRHRRSNAEATLLLATRAEVDDFGGGVGVDLEGRVVSLRPGNDHGEVDRRRVFAGVHVFAPDLVRGIDKVPADFVGDLYEPILERGGRIAALESRRRWHELGNPDNYLSGTRQWARGRWPMRLVRRRWIAPGATVASDARVSRSVIETGATVAAGAEISRSIVLPGAVVAEGCRVRRSIIGFDAELPPETRVEHRMVTPERADLVPRESDSVVGGLTYSRMSTGGATKNDTDDRGEAE